MLKTIASALVISVALSGAAFAADKAAADAAIAEAQAAYDKANKKGIAWRDTAKMIKKAKAAVEKGDFDKAVKTAGKAKFEGEMAYEQGMQQMTADNWSYLD
ncbi:hypothetical protein [Solemya velum gill symbiont]|uniref:hypothetical protein n=1 Tax=Solemya velum gill symbiont TaxID=2340 RepID=UPI000996E184|nr:hypothetical protein [Solemya velum gill symbiont]OOZ43922.1 hypothetical protein BOW37_08480 [Solemya velum gill symbiont]OOZ46656.1 hypothetical protein BOW38_06450 [Solemya velum gill symbiont]OOZ49099.1 hypothetical protein BOW39_07400 [Solemya velum gill symbiont]OOZ51466.1 hypothetical protein BOW40_07230 [Solemya velum gill symbiont]OOZ54080.1 hypothetical protein BOW41_07240 [Solemya velum gill symbiont]